MALVVFLRGINVGGHRRFRPSVLARELSAYDVVNVGSTGTLIVRKPGARAKFFAELRRKLPFEAELASCDGSDLVRLKWRIRLELSHHTRMLFDLLAFCPSPLGARLPFRSRFRQVTSGLYESSGREIALSSECTGAT